MPGLREYLSHRPNRVMYITLKFTHPAFEQVRLVADQMFQKTLGGEVYSPCRMEVSESEQSDIPIIQCAVKLSRVAQDIKQGLKGWDGGATDDPHYGHISKVGLYRYDNSDQYLVTVC